MADPQRRGFRLWPRRKKAVVSHASVAPPSAQELAEKMTELMHFERGIAALYYLLPDDILSRHAQAFCQTHQAQNVLEPGVDRELRTAQAELASWTAASVVWRSDIWQPGEILATFSFRMIEGLRAQPEVWSVIVDPQAQFFGLAAARSDEHRFWFVLVTGRKSEGAGAESATAAR
ncbi:MAG: hypothetical protein ACREOH_14075 [Candidatus Entotheonellia bacterium]